MAGSQVSLKLLINSETKKVLFAEAGKDCVDFLFNILSLPIATVIRLLREQGMVGSLGNLYESIENLNETYIQPYQKKDALLKPIAPAAAYSVPLLLFDSTVVTEKLFYKCGCCHNFSYSDNQSTGCTNCRRQMTSPMNYVAPPTEQKSASSEGGFVKGVVTYMVMDDLVVTPMSTISSITLLNKFNVKEVGSLQEKLVHIGMNEVYNAYVHISTSIIGFGF
ncbi:hypothetical protein ACJIZ3_017303 [Penstemon smallii]|uniref:DUF674 domain-containing protein n=1 Tax=Penstemon smallii TaxID=265156 RepID=A0ABD3SV45_9LAMI